MKAFEARKTSVQPQYDSAMEDIEKAMGWGWKSTHVVNTTGTLYPEVAKMLAKDGFDIKIVKRAEDYMSYNEVSWENAEEGKEGTITYVDETQLKPKPNPNPIDRLFKDILNAVVPESEENKTNPEAEE